MEDLRVLILGKGKVGRAIAFFLKKIKATKKVVFFTNEKEVKSFDILIGALPGEVGEKGLELALKYKKNLIDLSDLEPEFYLKKKREIERKEIIVIPGCGFCPGLINLILGWELSNQKEIKEIEIKAGTLSPKKFFFPFLWCFEDLILEHQIPSWQIINDKKVKFPPFADYQKDKFFGIEAETYFGQGGFDNLIKKSGIKNFKFRIVRTPGFSVFFQYLKNYGFLNKNNLDKTKKILENKKRDNLTVAKIKILTTKKKIIWQIKSFSKEKEKLNSMQKITGILPAIMVKLLSKGEIEDKGLIFMEDIGKNEKLFKEILKEIKNADEELKIVKKE